MTSRRLHFDVRRRASTSRSSTTRRTSSSSRTRASRSSSASAPTSSPCGCRRPCSSRATSPIYLRTPPTTTPSYVETGGDAVDGTVRLHSTSRRSRRPARTRRCALPELAPAGAARAPTPTFFGVFAWSAARLFVEKAVALGGKLEPRDAGRRAPQGPTTGPATACTSRSTSATKRTGDCWRFIQLNGGKWQPVGGTKYICAGTTHGLRRLTMSSFIAYTLFGLFSGAAYAIAASGLVLTYTHHPGLQHRARRVRHAAGLRLLGLQRQAGAAHLAGAGRWCSSWSRPAIGWFIARFVARGLGDAPVSVSLVVTVGLLVALHRRRRSRSTRPSRAPCCRSSPSTSFEHRRRHHHRPPADHDPGLGRGGGRALPAAQPDPDRHRDARLGRQPRAAPALRRQARPGRRAVLGDRHLAGRARRHPARLRSSAWTTSTLTLLVINAYAAAMLGRLKSLPLTFVGAMGLGLLQSYAAGYLPHDGLLGQVEQRRPGAVPVRRDRGDAAGPAADRPGQGHRLGAAAVAAAGARLGRRAAAVRRAAGRRAVRGQPAAGRHRGDVRDRDAVAGAAHRATAATSRWPSSPSPASARSTYAKLDEPNLYGLLLVGARRGRRSVRWWRCRCCG